MFCSDSFLLNLWTSYVRLRMGPTYSLAGKQNQQQCPWQAAVRFTNLHYSFSDFWTAVMQKWHDNWLELKMLHYTLLSRLENLTFYNLLIEMSHAKKLARVKIYGEKLETLFSIFARHYCILHFTKSRERRKWELFWLRCFAISWELDTGQNWLSQAGTLQLTTVRKGTMAGDTSCNIMYCLILHWHKWSSFVPVMSFRSPYILSEGNHEENLKKTEPRKCNSQ